MKFLPLVWKNIWRRKFRTTFTLLSIFIAFLLFGFLMTIRDAFAFGVEIAGARSAGADPQGQPDHAAAGLVPGAAAGDAGRRRWSTHNTWFGGIYQDPSNFFAQDRRRARAVPEDLPGVQAAARAGEGLARRSAGRHRRQAISRSASAGRSATACRSRARSGSRSSGDDLGVQHRRHLRRRRRRRQDAVLLPLRLPRREPHAAARAWSAGTSSRSPIRRRRSEMSREVRRDVRELVGRNQDDDREGVRRGLRQADRRHRRDHDRDSRRRCCS